MSQLASANVEGVDPRQRLEEVEALIEQELAERGPELISNMPVLSECEEELRTIQERARLATVRITSLTDQLAAGEANLQQLETELTNISASLRTVHSIRIALTQKTTATVCLADGDLGGALDSINTALADSSRWSSLPCCNGLYRDLEEMQVAIQKSLSASSSADSKPRLAN